MYLYPRANLLLAALGSGLLAILLLILPDDTGPADAEPPTQTISLDIQPLPSTVAAAEYEGTAPRNWRHAKIRRGDSLARIFSKQGFSPRDLHEIMGLGSEVQILRKILPGQTLSFLVGDDGGLAALKYQVNPLEHLIVERAAHERAAHERAAHERAAHERAAPGFVATRVIMEADTLTRYNAAAISERHPSLYESGKAVGLSDNIIMELSYVFQWDISFALDLRDGDNYRLVYEESHFEGTKVDEGEILAAEFTNMGRAYQAVLYRAEDGQTGYYTPDGKSMRKAFLRDPVHFSRVSSRFNLRRLHPIHKRVMPHRGIDYAANEGTPVVASGDGTVSIARYNRASGNYVVVNHGEQYTTKYLHLSRFARGIRSGKRVRQGQTIGYVGATGWATAPHLHYEFLVNGVQRNPRTVKLPMASPIPKAELATFIAKTSPYLDELNKIAPTQEIAAR